MIYYGEEIGVRMIEDLPNKEGSVERSRNRAPMQWDSTPNAGFSKASEDKLYLPIDKSADRPTVEAQESDPNSLLSLVQRVIALRKSEPAFEPSADLQVLSTGYPLTYIRGNRFLVTVNPRRNAAEIDIDDSRPLTGLCRASTKRRSQLRRINGYSGHDDRGPNPDGPASGLSKEVSCPRPEYSVDTAALCRSWVS